MKIFSIYDSKAEAWFKPVAVENTANYKRGLEKAVQDPNSDLHAHAADFTAFEIASWDDRSGQLTVYETKINLGNCLIYKKTELNSL